MQNIHFRTSSRDDIVDLIRRLVGAIDPVLLGRPAQPLNIVVNGSRNSGKKIFPDETVALLLGPDRTMTGRENFDELHRGTSGGQEAEIGFINMDLASLLGEYSDELDAEYKRIYCDPTRTGAYPSCEHTLF